MNGRLFELGETDDTLDVCETVAAAQASLAAGRTVLVGELSLLRGLPVDIVVAATGVPTVDAEVAGEKPDKTINYPPPDKTIN